MNNYQNLTFYLAIVVLTAGILVFDYLTPLGIAGGIPYVAVVLLTLWLPSSRETLSVAIACTMLTLLGFFISEPGEKLWIVLTNRFLAIFGIWSAVLFILRYKRYVRKLGESESRFRALFESSSEGIIVTEYEGKIILTNPGVQNLFGYKDRELLGKSIEILVPDRFRDEHVRERGKYYKNPKSRKMGRGRDLYGKRIDGTEFPVEISLSYFRQQGKLYVIAFIVDITERKRAENSIKKANRELRKYAQELKQSNAELEQFAYVASHDLQEPLRMVSSYTQLLSKRYQDKLDEDTNDFIYYAVDGARRMQHLINDLLQYSRVGTQGKPFYNIDLNKVIDKASRDLSRLIEETGAKIEPGSLPKAYGDETQLTQLFQNLIHNALKFRGDNVPVVWIEGRETNKELQITLKDNGIGIDPKYNERIFMIFQRLHNREQYKGSGIGLAICKKIVERHGGTIWLDSEVGTGTTFYFTLPKEKRN